MSTNLNPADEIKSPRVALGVTGGIAAYKAAEILRGLQRAGCIVRVAMTEHATKMIAPLTFRALSGSHVVVDDYAPDNSDPIAHITFSQTVDLFLIAPATANAIAKLANGIADDFLTSTYLACTAPIIVAPAMNTTMWQHPATQRNIAQLRADGVHIIEPDAGEMACGTMGPGRLSEPDTIVTYALEVLRRTQQFGNFNAPSEPTLSLVSNRDLVGERILITAGATREEIDPVRFISNRSSGRMGFALAEAATERGAEVTIIAGITTATPPTNMRLLRVTTADEMHAAVMFEIKNSTVFIAAAAVTDYRPASRKSTKIKKSREALTLTLEPTPDILADVSKHRHDNLLIIGFAAETNDVLKYARTKLERKNLDAIIANDVTQNGAGFETDTNIITIITRSTDGKIGVSLELPQMTKLEVAHRILGEVVRLRHTKQFELEREKAAADESRI